MLTPDKFPLVSNVLVSCLKDIFPNSIDGINTIEELNRRKGQQDIITYLNTMYMQQQGKEE